MRLLHARSFTQPCPHPPPPLADRGCKGPGLKMQAELIAVLREKHKDQACSSRSISGRLALQSQTFAEASMEFQVADGGSLPQDLRTLLLHLFGFRPRGTSTDAKYDSGVSQSASIAGLGKPL